MIVPGPSRSRLVGRAAEIASVAAWLEEGRPWITLVGPVGVGKSAIAREAVARVHPQRGLATDGNAVEVTRAELSEVSTVGAFLHQLARALGADLLDSSEDEQAISELGRSLAARPRVVLLDNADDAIFAAPILERWLSDAPELTFVVTSGEAFARPGESRLEVRPLSVEGPSSPALELFLRHLPLDKHASIASDPETHELLRSLDGIPLAITLAAGLAQVLPMTAVREAMSSARGPGNVDLAQNDLDRALERSIERLGVGERLLLERLSVFRGSFDAAGAADVVGASEVLASLHKLRRASLLTDAEPTDFDQLAPSAMKRLRMLNTVRAHVRRRLAPADREAGERAHLAFLARRAVELRRQLEGHTPEQAAAEFLIEEEDLRDALERFATNTSAESVAACTSIAFLLSWHCPGVELGRITAAVSRLAATGLSGRDGAALEAWLAWYASRRGDFEGARQALARGRALLRDGDDVEEALLGRSEGVLEASEGRLLEARAFGHEVLERAIASGNPIAQAFAHDVLTTSYRSQPDGDAAERHGVAAVRLYESQGFLLRRVQVLGSLAFVCAAEGRPNPARRYASQAMELLDRLYPRSKPYYPRIWLEMALARVDQAEGHFDVAVSRLQRARRDALSVNHWEFAISAQFFAALGTVVLGDLDGADALLQASLAEMTQPFPPHAALGWLVHAASLAKRGHHGAAADSLSRATTIAQTFPHPATARLLPVADSIVRLAAAFHDGVPLDPGLVSTVRAYLDTSSPADCETATFPALKSILAPPKERARVKIQLGPEGRVVKLGDDVSISCARRPVMQRILVGLANAHAGGTGRSLSVDDLGALGWPGEKMRTASAKRRVQVMISRIRELGVGSALENTPDVIASRETQTSPSPTSTLRPTSDRHGAGRDAQTDRRGGARDVATLAPRPRRARW